MRRIAFVCIAIYLISCGEEQLLRDKPVSLHIPSGFPPIQYPEGNEPSELRLRLGRILFYDNRLSMDHSVNCGTCHVLSAAFTDGKAKSIGRAGTEIRRNAPTLANIAWMPRLMMEGGVPSLETQVLSPLHDSLEMGFNMMTAVHTLNQDEELKALAKAAYGRDSIDPWVVTRALACFERSFISGDSYYDRYRQGQSDALSEEAVAGMKLFFSEKTGCAECHSGVFFTDFGYHNIGLYEEYADSGKERASHDSSDIGKFKTPTLRNIALTAPYMHDGSLNTLQDVIAFFNDGGHDHPNKDERIHPLQLTEKESAELISFLTSLSDYNFVQSAHLLPLER